VPETVALTGFDDLDTLRGVVPALTTVRQPTDELGAAGLQRLVSLMNGGEAGPGDKLAPELVVRRSCGCSVTRDSPRAPSSGLSLQATLVDRRALISAELSRSARGALFGVGSGWESRLLTTFLSDLTSPGATAFVGAVHGMLLRLSRNGVDPALLQPVLAQLRTAVYECAGSDPQGRVRASDLFEATRETLSEFLIRSETSRRVAALRQVRGFGAVVTSLLGAPPIEQVRAALTERFTALGVGAMAVGLFTEPGRVTEECLCVVAYNDAVSATPAERFRARDLCPPQLFAREKRPLLIQPLTFQGQPLGLVTTVLGSFENNVYEQLREALSAALYGYRLALARSVQS
jgi:hypothetical protein